MGRLGGGWRRLNDRDRSFRAHRTSLNKLRWISVAGHCEEALPAAAPGQDREKAKCDDFDPELRAELDPH